MQRFEDDPEGVHDWSVLTPESTSPIVPESADSHPSFINIDELEEVPQPSRSSYRMLKDNHIPEICKLTGRSIMVHGVFWLKTY